MEEKNKIPEKKSDEEIQIHQEGKLTKKIRENPWILSTFVLGIFVLILMIGNFGSVTGGVISEDDAKNAVLNFVESQGSDAEVIGVKDDGTFYEVTILFQDQEIPLYVTKNGEYFTSSLIPLSVIDEESSQQTSSSEVIKSDKPVVELFVMTHCPYGTQSEKGIIPAIKALGDTIDAKIRFVHYFMHEPEETETPRQVCIREEQSDKYYDYLECFLEDGDFDRCVTKVGIDKNKMNNCVLGVKADEYYEEDSILSEGYGVTGSPSLIINGVKIQSGRDSASYLDTICSAFNIAPEECNTELSSTSPSPGFGWEGTGSDTGAQC